MSLIHRLQLGRSRNVSAVAYQPRLFSRTRLAPISSRVARHHPRTVSASAARPLRGFFNSAGRQDTDGAKSADELRQARLLRQEHKKRQNQLQNEQQENDREVSGGKEPAWSSFTRRFESFSDVTDIEWKVLSDRIVDLILPEWSKNIPMQIRKLQRELSLAPGSLADIIWHDAHDPFSNPEIRYSASVRVSDELCDEEKEFLARRKRIARAALARYLGIDEIDIHPDDVPTIAMCGSGGGLRALVAGAGSLLATQQDGLFDCVTYTSGVSGSCWLQTLYNSSIAQGRFDLLLNHLKARLGVHIAYPPVAFESVITSPTNQLLLCSLVEKLRGDQNADFGLVDIYGILLAGRLLVPKGELGINAKDFKLSNQRDYIKYGQNPMPIYTAVRHEIPNVGTDAPVSEADKEKAKQEAWFQWFEMTPYEFFCEEFNAGIPTWAIGRRFDGGEDVPSDSGLHMPEVRVPFLMGIWGSAFCATLSHYYREVRPLVKSLTGFGAIDGMISTHSEDLEKVHPFEPATIPNFVYNMDEKLRFTTPTQIHEQEYIQLMDAGMSNNLPIYPLLRPGRDIDIVIAFDASADVKTDNWLSVADGYARQRGIKGWPVGVGWPKASDSPKEVEEQLEAAEAHSAAEADAKLSRAQGADLEDDKSQNTVNNPTAEPSPEAEQAISHPEVSDLGYCTIWIGDVEERSSEPPPPSKALGASFANDEEAWQTVVHPKSGLAVVYLPFLTNPKVEGVNPTKSDYMSTWNFVYTPEQIDKVVALAQANYDEGKEQIRGCVRAIYERKKKNRETQEHALRRARDRRLTRLGIVGKLGEGDHFS
ncbi:cytosolic phospholipase A2 zeta [Microdochium trichocladiopsis]|uniref:Lysophospholipase n=1 Tax=Microdochium trichocladiopsis TaxID=1682393 RepID=A0A9P8Y9G3_9PEZI|nr:cytosolic phospholipase A2 zeta [Microdochium trichocladiopsis]KAH7031229.1 cytosolic phospholipase A2 zeta [Microdochium trichocladiopsis]